MKRVKTNFLTQSALIAGIYVVLTYVSAMMGMSSGAIQVRLSEALTILPCFTTEAIPGLFVGCILANLLTGSVFWDIVFGSIATLIGAIFTRLLKNKKFLAPIPPILSNTVIIPFVLAYAYNAAGGIPYFMLTIFIGEFISCGILGIILYSILDKHRDIF